MRRREFFAVLLTPILAKLFPKSKPVFSSQHMLRPISGSSYTAIIQDDLVGGKPLTPEALERVLEWWDKTKLDGVFVPKDSIKMITKPPRWNHEKP